MTVKSMRKIVIIDEEKCNGCGQCAITCAEGALKIIDGKAKLISETYCDGLGTCLGECPQGAISIEERPADDFNEEKAKRHLAEIKQPQPGDCTGSAVRELSLCEEPAAASENKAVSRLAHWPVQLALVFPEAPFLKNAQILLTADCVPIAYARFQEDFVKDHVPLVACPKLDNFAAHQDKLVQILKTAKPKNLTVVHMEVPCCSGLIVMAKQAIKEAGAKIHFKEKTISTTGKIQ